MDLTQYREQIDQIDSQIVELYEQRMEVAKGIAEYKLSVGKKVFDKQREVEKLEKVSSLAHSDFNAKGVKELFEQIMSVSRKLQYGLLAEHGSMGKLPFIAVEELDAKGARVVYQGAPGAYSQAAMFSYFGENVNCVHVDTFKDALSCIEEGSADYAVLPIENSTAGIVSEVYDRLLEFEAYIVAEQDIKIEHCLMATPGTKKEQIQRVYSHAQSLMQSAQYLQQYDWQQISMKNNAFAASKVAMEKDVTQAAIAGEHAAKIYGLEILEKGINQEVDNTTRFVVVSNQKIFRKSAKKVSVCFEVPHKSGSLYHMLSHFIYNDLNLTKIESRPIPDRSWEYRFFVEFEGNLADPAVKNALRGLREEARNMSILGNY